MDDKHFPAEKMLALGFHWSAGAWRYKEYAIEYCNNHSEPMFMLSPPGSNIGRSCHFLDTLLNRIFFKHERFCYENEDYEVEQYIHNCELMYNVCCVVRKRVSLDREGERLVKGYFDGEVPEGILMDKLEDLV